MLNPEDIINESEDVREFKRACAVSMYAEETEVGRICIGIYHNSLRIAINPKFHRNST